MHQKECLRINLTKEEKDLYESGKTPRRDTEEDRHKWTGAPYDGPEEQLRYNVYTAQSNLQTMQSLSRVQWQFFFTKTEKTILTVARNHKRPQIAKAILKKNKTRVIILPDLNLYYKAMVIRTLWHLHKKAHRSMAQN